MAYQPNPGRLPEACLLRDDSGNVVGFRAVHVRLRCGYDSKAAGHQPWPSKGARGGDTNWKISRPGFPGDIEFWEVA